MNTGNFCCCRMHPNSGRCDNSRLPFPPWYFSLCWAVSTFNISKENDSDRIKFPENNSWLEFRRGPRGWDEGIHRSLGRLVFFLVISQLEKQIRINCDIFLYFTGILVSGVHFLEQVMVYISLTPFQPFRCKKTSFAFKVAFIKASQLNMCFKRNTQRIKQFYWAESMFI